MRCNACRAAIWAWRRLSAYRPAPAERLSADDDAFGFQPLQAWQVDRFERQAVLEPGFA